MKSVDAASEPKPKHLPDEPHSLKTIITIDLPSNPEDRALSALFKKLRHRGQLKRESLQPRSQMGRAYSLVKGGPKQLNLSDLSYQSNGSTDKSEHQSQATTVGVGMYSPPGLNINTNLQAGDPFFDSLSPMHYSNEGLPLPRNKLKMASHNGYPKEESK